MTAVELSPRLRAVVDALPLQPGMRVLEIGCGPGAAAREVARRLDGGVDCNSAGGYVHGIDRSARAVAQAVAGSSREIALGRLGFSQVAVDDFCLGPGEEPYDLAFAVRVGVLDGRHPEGAVRALNHIAAALRPGGRLFVDTGDPMAEVVVRR